MLITLGNPNTKKPIVRAIQTVLGALTGGEQREVLSRRVFIHSYDEDFGQLWNEPHVWDQPLSADDVLIVIREQLDGPTFDLPEAGEYLTALDWAVWYCLKRVGIQNSVADDIPTIIVIELNAQRSNKQPNADRFFQMFGNRNVRPLPWIKIIQSLSSANQPCCLVQLLKSIRETISAVSDVSDLSMIRQIWQSFFLRPSKPSDNHALANLLGASLLTGDFGNSTTRQALMKFMRTLQLLPQPSDSQHNNEGSGIVHAAANAMHVKLHGTARRTLQFLLVDDDQQRHNWSGFVAGSLGLSKSKDVADYWTGTIGNFGACLSATDSAQQLLDALALAIRDSRNLRWNSGPPLDVLFLDLRLFERADLRDEAAFIVEVISSLRQANEHRPGLPGDWPRMDVLSLTSIEKWCRLAIGDAKTVSRDDTQYIDAVTLLPRLVSIVQPDLPIILFSSTQRRRVAEILKPYGNIITSFSKPALQLGQDSERIAEAHSQFQRAIAQAFDLVHARRLRQSLIARDFPVYWQGHVEKPIDETSTEPWSVQLLLDETGDEPLTVGGFIAIYPPGVSPGEVNDQIYSAHPQVRSGKAGYRKQNLSSIVWNAVRILEGHQVLILPIALTGKRTWTTTAQSNWFGSDAFRDEMVGDNLHRELMRCLIELGLFVFARQILPENASVEFSFHAPTRVLPVEQDEARCLNATWGIQLLRDKDGRPIRNDEGKSLAIHLDRSSARSIMEEISREYRGSAFEPTAALARAFGLSDNAPDSEKQKVYALQYLADGWLNDHSDPELQSFNELAIEGDYGPKFRRLLEAHRCLVQGDIPRAIEIGAEVAMNLKATQHSTAMNSILVALQSAAISMTGPEIMTLASLLKHAKPDRPDHYLQGVIREITSPKRLIKIESGGKIFTAISKHCKTDVIVGDAVQFQPRRGNRLGSLLAHAVRRLDSEAETADSE